MYSANVLFYKKENVTSYSFLSPEELEKGLILTEKNYVDAYIEAERIYGVNAIFLAAVSAQESGWGESYLAKNYNNLFGWQGGSWSSPRECILDVARMLSERYLSPNGPYCRGLSIYDIAKTYCDDGTWAEYVDSIARQITSRIAIFG